MLNRVKSFRPTPSLIALTILLFVIVPDLLLRTKEILIWENNYRFFYSLSCVMSFTFYYLTTVSINKIKWLKFKMLLGLPVALFTTLSVFGSLGYRTYFGNIPTIFTLKLLIEEPAEALVSVQNEISIIRICIVIAIAAFLFLLFLSSKKPSPKLLKTKLVSSSLLFVGIWLILNNQVRFVDQCFTLDTNILITTGKMVQNSFSKKSFNRTGMHAGTRPIFTSSGKAPGFNVLVIVNESVRSVDFPLNDTTRTQMPLLKARYLQNPNEYFPFPNAYGTATTTMVAYPTAICGGNSQTEVSALHNLPLLWNYSNKFDCDQYLLSSHVYYWRNFITFVNDKSLEKIWYQEVSGYPAPAGFFGIDDKYTLDSLFGCLDRSITKKRNFMAVFHTYDQHYPYFFPEKKQNTHTHDDYLKSEGYLDKILAKAETFLKEKNILDNTIILFTSDHGEAFGEHGQFSHVSVVYREAANVAFFLKIPLALQNKYNIEMLKSNLGQVVSNADMAPTIIDLYGLRNDPEVAKVIPQLPGRSLFLPITDNRKVIVSSNTEYAVFRDEHGVGIFGKDESLIFRFLGGKPQFEFFDLKNDPAQTKNIWSLQTDSVKRDYEKIFLDNINLKRTYDLVIKKQFNNF